MVLLFKKCIEKLEIAYNNSLSTNLSVLDVLEYLVYRNVKVLVLVLVLDPKVLGT